MNTQPLDPQDPQINPSTRPRARTWIVWLAVLGGIILLMVFRDHLESPAELITQARFVELLSAGAIEHAVVNYSSQGTLNTVAGRYYLTNNSGVREVPFRAKVRLTSRLENQIFSYPQIEPHEQNSVLLSVVVSILPLVVIAALIWFFVIRQIKKAGVQRNPQHERLDEILSKWEAQITRMDAILSKWERSQRAP